MTKEIIKILDEMQTIKAKIKECDGNYRKVEELKKSGSLIIEGWEVKQDSTREKLKLDIREDLKLSVLVTIQADYCAKKSRYEKMLNDLVLKLQNLN